MGGVFDAAESRIFDSYEYFRKSFERFYRFVIDMGFTITNCCYPMSVDNNSGQLNAVYQATSAEDIVHFTTAERVSIYRALFDVISRFRSHIRIFHRSVPYTRSLGNIRRDNHRAIRVGVNANFFSSMPGTEILTPAGTGDMRISENFGR